MERTRRLTAWLVIAAGILALPTESFAQPRAMRANRMRLVPGITGGAAGNATNARNAPTQDAFLNVPFEGTVDAALIQQVRERLEKEAASLKRQHAADGKDPAPELKAGSPRAMIDMAHYGVHHFQNAQHRFLALHLLIDNPAAEPLVISRADITAKIDGEAKPWDEHATGQHLYFPYGTLQQNLAGYKPPAEVKAPAQGVAGGWLVYVGLPMISDVPSVSVSLKAGGQTIDIDVTASQRALLNLDVETLGPRDCLRLMMIQGMLTSVNAQTLVETLERLADQKVVRAVVRWSDEAYLPEQQVIHWLIQSASQIGTGRPAMDQFPALPAPLREFHLVQTNVNGFPNFDQYGRPASGSHMHKTASDAISAALKSAYLALPMNELLEEIERGHPLTRPAALRHGSGRLGAAQLPFLLERIEDADADIRVAAVRALSQFGEPAALDKLVALARNSGDPLSGPAIESLASSRYAAAQTKLLDLTRQEKSDVKKQIMQVLARYPRPQWSEPIYAYVTDPEEQLPIEGVRALLRVGHPRLVDILETCLKSPEKPLRELAFPILALRSDARSERLATDYALAELQQRPPDGAIVQFLYRTKLPAAIPLLLKHLETGSDKVTIINLLAQIGDDAAGDAIAQRYEKLQNHEKSSALTALHQLRHAKFRPLAGEALLSNDSSQIQQATQGLMQDGDTEAGRLLVAALEKQTNNFALSQICNALGNLGGPEARQALLKARESDNKDRKNYAINALLYLRQRSPGFQYIYQAQHHGQQKQWKEALEFFDLSLQIDPELPEALSGRASVKQRLGKDEEAAKDFEKAYELDPYNSLALSGVAIVRVQAGKIEDGLKVLESGRERNQHDPVFIYNAACVFARASEYFQKHKDAPDREARQEEFRKKAIAELQLATTRGFSDFNTMVDDPDLKVLKDDPEFKKLIGNRPLPMPENEEPADADAEE